MDRHVFFSTEGTLMDELARLLGHERRLLELLLFKLVESKHLLAAGEARFLPSAAAEVERAMEKLQETELRRSMLVHRLAAELDVPEAALTMTALAKDSVEPFRTIFADHRQAFLELAAEIETVTAQNRRLAERRVHNVEELMAVPLDLQMAQFGYRAVLGGTTRLTMPWSLVDFLRQGPSVQTGTRRCRIPLSSEVLNGLARWA